MRKGNDSARRGSKGAAGLSLAVIVAAVSGQAPSDLRLGLRLDAASSMQWSGGTIYAEGAGRDVLDTTVKSIDAVWPGSVTGSFVVFSEQGVGMLLGRDLVSAGPVLDPGALIRSSRPDALWVSVPARSNEGRAETRFVEWRGPSRSRHLASIPGSIVDFDVDAEGRLLYLTLDRRAFLLAAANQPPVEVVLPARVAGAAERVFIDAQGTQIVVYGKGALVRFSTEDRRWSDLAFDVRRHALVRHASSRRVLIEDRFEDAAAR